MDIPETQATFDTRHKTKLKKPKQTTQKKLTNQRWETWTQQNKIKVTGKTNAHGELSRNPYFWYGIQCASPHTYVVLGFWIEVNVLSCSFYINIVFFVKLPTTVCKLTFELDTFE